MPVEPEQLPSGTGFMDVVAAAQAAWLACDYVLARDLIRRYIDPSGEFCCMRCSSMEHELWRVNTGTAGTFLVCPACTTVISGDQQFMNGMRGSEIFMEGPKQRLVQKTAFNGGVRVNVKTSQQHVTLVKR